MSRSPRLRSAMALLVAAVLVGTPALPLALCALEGGEVHCADMPQSGSQHKCHDSDTPPAATMSCCCDRDAGTLPLSVPTFSAVAGAALAIPVSPVHPILPRRTGRTAIETTILQTRHRPLFTLFSVFLI